MYFESLHTGLYTVTPRRTVNTAKLDTFLDNADLHPPMFLDDESAIERGHPRRIVTGPKIFAGTMGLVRADGRFDQVVAVLEFNQCPTHPNIAP
ncbi:MAG: hypothetical protein IH600_16170 [Bacteroidetes bacterium]|nr:hypothetical protein [Bacteroidota bacterium]